jgi:Spy/CpxP family protein refolding chaperone
MFKRKVIPFLCLATSLAGWAVYAAAAQPAGADPASSADGPAAHGWHHGHEGFGPMGFVLHKLNLTSEQKTQVKSIFADEKSQFEALRASANANREALATTPPTDPGYAALVQTAQNNAATRIKLESETWSAIYGNVLTKEQRDAIPGIVAAAQAKRQARMSEWQAQPPQSGAPSSN